jgi:hypothetical protein
MGEMCSTHVNLIKNLKGIYNLGYASTVEDVILQCILIKECNNEVHISLAQQCLVPDSCEHRNE